jgi:hypothetical protein
MTQLRMRINVSCSRAGHKEAKKLQYGHKKKTAGVGNGCVPLFMINSYGKAAGDIRGLGPLA